MLSASWTNPIKITQITLNILALAARVYFVRTGILIRKWLLTVFNSHSL